MPLRGWYAEASRSGWRTPADIKAAHRSASFLANHRVVFNIKGNCPVPCDYLPKRSYPLFRAREVLEYLALGGAGGSPEGDQRLPPGPAPRRG
ncbi:MAG: type II toxin-antitoxin system HigB family toxin [Chromatiaceae bacterium]